MASLPQDQLLRIDTRNQRLIVLSVAEKGLQIGDGMPYGNFSNSDMINGVHFFTENVAVTTSVSAAYGLTLSTWGMVCSETGTTLRTTGQRGKDDGESTTRDGQPGGVLSLYIQDLDDATAKTLNLVAQGGQGGDTYSSSGTVGNGGDGGSIISVLQPTYSRVLAYVQEYFDRNEFHPDDHGKYRNQVVVGDSLYTQARAVGTVIKYLSATDDTINSIYGQLSVEIKKIDASERRTVLDIKRAVSSAIHKMKDLISSQKFQLAPTVGNVRGGYPGRGVDVSSSAGRQGAKGRENQLFLTHRFTTEIAKSQRPFAHPVQCAMLLDRANVFFYINSPLLRSHARGLYQRLIDRLSFLPLQSDDPLLRAYQQSSIMPSTSLNDLAGIMAKATDQLVHLNAGQVNYHGFTPLWVPRASYTFYKQALDDALADIASFEKAYIKYSLALSNQENLNDKVKLAYEKTSRSVASLNADVVDLKMMLQGLERAITKATPIVQEAHQKLINAYNAERNAIKVAFGLSIPQVINAFTFIAFSPGKLMTSLQATDLIYQGFSSIPTIDGTTVTKEYLTSEFRQSEATLDNISTLLKNRVDGMYQLDDPFATRLIVEKEQILAQLDKFSQEAFGGVHDSDKKKDLKDGFNSLIDAVTKRNNSILQYNITVKLIISKVDEETGYRAMQTELNSRKIKENDPDIPDITAYVGAIYQSSRSRVMKLLDIVLRSLNYRMLIYSDVYEYAYPGTNPDHAADLDNVPLSLTSTTLMSVRENIEAKFNQEIEIWGTEPVKFPGDFDKDVGKRWFLNKSQRKVLLQDQEHMIVLLIPTVYKYSSKAGDFGGCCNVRIYRVRFGLTGLKTASALPKDKDALVKFTLRHGGSEVIVNRSNAGFEFEHDPVSTVFSFRVNGLGTKSVLDNGNIGESDLNQTATSYAALGPFTEWTVSMAGTEFARLDLSSVTEAYFDFCGTNYACD